MIEENEEQRLMIKLGRQALFLTNYYVIINVLIAFERANISIFLIPSCDETVCRKRNQIFKFLKGHQKMCFLASLYLLYLI